MQRTKTLALASIYGLGCGIALTLAACGGSNDPGTGTAPSDPASEPFVPAADPSADPATNPPADIANEDSGQQTEDSGAPATEDSDTPSEEDSDTPAVEDSGKP